MGQKYILEIREVVGGVEGWRGRQEVIKYGGCIILLRVSFNKVIYILSVILIEVKGS